MSDPYRYPKLRWPIEVRFETFEQQNILLISCPLGISREPLALIPAVAPVISCFEGNLSIDDIVTKFEQYGLKHDIVNELIQLLDSNFFLATPRFYAEEQKMRTDYLNTTVREAAFAGLSYTNNRDKLALDIENFLNNKGAPLASNLTNRSMLGLMAPHIDYRRGGVCYGITYNFLRAQQHDLYVIIGTSHQYSSLMFHLTAKDFNSPLGMLPCDKTFVNKLGALYGSRSFKDEILHRREHSLELQTPFLRHLKNDPKIVPILVGSFHRMLASGRPPSEFDEYESFAGAFTTCLAEELKNGRKICIIAGVDMAHVGRNFGDQGNLTPEFMQDIHRRDQIYLDTLKRRDKRALFAHIAEDQDQRRICGFPTMYTVLDVFDRLGVTTQNEIYDYRQAVDYQADCAVTFAGMGFYESSSDNLAS